MIIIRPEPSRRRPPERAGNTSLPRLLRGNHCRCPRCLSEFNSLSAFDAHRAGPWGDRRCLTVNEMIGRGMRLSRSGWWVVRLAIPRGLSFVDAEMLSGALLPPRGRLTEPAHERRGLAEGVSP